MNFGEAKTRVQDAIGAGSNELTSQLGTFVTDALRDIHAAGRWPWDRKASTFSVLEDTNFFGKKIKKETRFRSLFCCGR